MDDAEQIQRIVARVVATHPAGRSLILIGGFRYRLLDESVRASRDMDYHWDGDLTEKQAELASLFNDSLLPQVRRMLGYNGSAVPATGQDSDSPVVRIVNLSFWKEGVPDSRIEIPVEVTRIARMDPSSYQTKDGTIYPTASEKDMVESKIIALLNRTFLQHRDFVDVYLFQDRLGDDSPQRLSIKFHELGIKASKVRERVSDFEAFPEYHVKTIQRLIDDQLDPGAADVINDAGGGRMILESVVGLLHRCGLGIGAT